MNNPDSHGHVDLILERFGVGITTAYDISNDVITYTFPPFRCWFPNHAFHQYIWLVLSEVSMVAEKPIVDLEFEDLILGLDAKLLGIPPSEIYGGTLVNTDTWLLQTTYCPTNTRMGRRIIDGPFGGGQPISVLWVPSYGGEVCLCAGSMELDLSLCPANETPISIQIRNKADLDTLGPRDNMCTSCARVITPSYYYAGIGFICRVCAMGALRRSTPQTEAFSRLVIPT